MLRNNLRIKYDFEIMPYNKSNIITEKIIIGDGDIDLDDSYLVELFLDIFKVPDKGREEILEKLRDEYNEDFSMRNLFEIRVSLYCNNDCIHCFIASRPKESHYSYEQITNMIDGAKEKMIGLSGGEPSIHPDFLRILKYIKSVGKRCSVQTHGRAFSNKKFTEECSKYIDQIMIPIHSSYDNVHDRVTRVDGSCKETWAGIKNLRDQDIQVVTQTVVNRENYKELLKIGNKIQKTIPGSRMVFTFPQAIGSAKTKDVVPTYTEIYPYLQQLFRKWAHHIHTHYFPPCMIFPYTDLVTCIDLVEFKLEIPGMDILDGDWEKINYGEYKNQNIRAPECDTCSFSKDCYGIPKGYQELGYALDLWPITPYHYSIRNKIKEDCIKYDISFMDRGLPEVDEEEKAGDLPQKYFKSGVETTEETSKIHSDIFKRILDSTFTLELTSLCNFKCTHCYVPEYVTKDFTLSMKEIREKINNIDINKFPIIKITGGEPTIHPNFLEAIDYASRKGLRVHVNTNGAKFADNDFLEEAIVNGMEAVSISLLSSDIDAFNSAIGEDMGELSWKGWENIIKTELILMPQLVLTKELYPSLLSTLDKIQKMAPGTRVFILGVKPVGRGLYGVMPKYEEIVEPLKEAIEKWGQFLTLEDVPFCYFDYTKVLIEDYDREDTHEKYEECEKCIVKERCFGFPIPYKTMYKPTPKAYLKK